MSAASTQVRNAGFDVNNEFNNVETVQYAACSLLACSPARLLACSPARLLRAIT